MAARWVAHTCRHSLPALLAARAACLCLCARRAQVPSLMAACARFQGTAAVPGPLYCAPDSLFLCNVARGAGPGRLPRARHLVEMHAVLPACDWRSVCAHARGGNVAVLGLRRARLIVQGTDKHWGAAAWEVRWWSVDATVSAGHLGVAGGTVAGSAAGSTCNHECRPAPSSHNNAGT